VPAPRFSLIIPAWNEEAYLPRLLDTVDVARRTYAGGADAIEVVVADNDSTDRTAEIAAARGCRVAHVRERRIACARNGGAAAARGEILCFVDADYRIHPETFNAIDRELATGRFIGGATGLEAERWSAGIFVTMVVVLALLRPWGIDGGVWFCRRQDFDAVGGYDERVRYSEDVRLLWALRKLGRRRRPKQKLTRGGSAGPRAPALASARKFDKHGDWHFLRDAALLGLWIVFAPRRAEAHAQRYWYEERD
jgi:glycosyltransferase involved in cell wall biosynthesis